MTMTLEQKRVTMTKIHKLNDLEAKYQHYETNTDNIWYWAKQRYNVEKPTDEQLNSIDEYPLNFDDYAKNCDVIGKAQKKIINDLKENDNIEVEFDGYCFRII